MTSFFPQKNGAWVQTRVEQRSYNGFLQTFQVEETASHSSIPNFLSLKFLQNYLQGSTLMDRSKSLTEETGIVIQPPMFSRKRNKTFQLNKTPFTACNLNYLDLLPVMKRIQEFMLPFFLSLFIASLNKIPTKQTWSITVTYTQSVLIRNAAKSHQCSFLANVSSFSKFHQWLFLNLPNSDGCCYFLFKKS